MDIESGYSLYPYPTLKEVITMLNRTYTFKDHDSSNPYVHGFPVIVKHDNGDGTYTGTLDTNNMSVKDKLFAITTAPVIPRFTATGAQY